MERNNEIVQEFELDSEQYSFMHEKIKSDKTDRQKVMYKLLGMAGKGLIFGIAASIGFFALKPGLEKTFQKNPNEITIPKDEEKENDEQVENQTASSPKVLTLDNYRELNYALSQVSAEAKKSIVGVRGVNNHQSWTVENEGIKSSTSGLIVANNGQELLILVDYSVLKEGQTFKVRFVDTTECEAVLKKKDVNLGMAVLGVSKGQIKESTWSRIKVARLGNSNILTEGKTLIALGDGVSYGVASSVNRKVVRADGTYNVIFTDIAGTGKNGGALFDVEGNVVGIIHPHLSEEENRGVLVAFGISSIKNEIELMSNAKDVPYVGIVGTIVTDEISKSQNIPKGLYVMEVEADSPAMKAGIQSGDVITEIGQEEINSLTEFHNAVISHEVGKELSLKGQRRGAEEYVEIGYTVIVGMKE